MRTIHGFLRIEVGGRMPILAYRVALGEPSLTVGHILDETLCDPADLDPVFGVSNRLFFNSAPDPNFRARQSMFVIHDWKNVRIAKQAANYCKAYLTENPELLLVDFYNGDNRRLYIPLIHLTGANVLSVAYVFDTLDCRLYRFNGGYTEYDSFVGRLDAHEDFPRMTYDLNEKAYSFGEGSWIPFNPVSPSAT